MFISKNGIFGKFQIIKEEIGFIRIEMNNECDTGSNNTGSFMARP